MRSWLRALRQLKKLSEKAVAESAGIAQPYYHNIEMGYKCPSVAVAKKIASVLGFEWTLFYEDEKSA